MTPDVGTTAPDAATRPRVEGDREQEILDATLDVLGEVGYDRLTMDAVAGAARASKATLYRRWSTKSALVIEALCRLKEPVAAPDTGTLRGDLLAMFCGAGGATDHRQTAVLGSVFTAIARDADFAAAFRAQFIQPKLAVSQTVFERARGRGEVRGDLDLEVVVAALPGIVLHRSFLLGQETDDRTVERVVDQLLLPAVSPATTDTPTSPTLPREPDQEETR